MKGPIHSFYSLITLPGVTPVPSTIFPMAGPVTGFTFGRLLSLFALLGETTVPGDSLLYHGIPVPGVTVWRLTAIPVHVN